MVSFLARCARREQGRQINSFAVPPSGQPGNQPSRFSAWRLFVWLEMPNTIASPLLELAHLLVRLAHIAHVIHKPRSQHYVIGCETLRSRAFADCAQPRVPHATEWHARRRLDRYHDVLYANEPEKRAASGPPEVMRKKSPKTSGACTKLRRSGVACYARLSSRRWDCHWRLCELQD